MRSNYPQNVFWMDKDGKESPSTSLDSASQPREGYLFLRCEDRSYPVFRCKVTDLASLTASPLFKDRMYLQLPQGTTDADFQMLYLFLVHGVYPSSLKQLHDPSGHNTQGAPMIVPTGTLGVPSLLPLVTAYKLALTIKYKPFSEHILKGLRGLHATADDPTAILEKMYPSLQQSSSNTWPALNEVKPADAQLRSWVKTWLAVIRDPIGRYGAKCDSNLAVLRQVPDFKDRFARSCERSEELMQDVKAAEGELSRKYGGNNAMSPSLTPTMVPSFLQGIPRGLDIFEPRLSAQGSNPPHFWTDNNSIVNAHPQLDLNRHQYLDAFGLADLRNAVPRALNPTQKSSDGVTSWQGPSQPRMRDIRTFPYVDPRNPAARENVLPILHEPPTEAEMAWLNKLWDYGQQSLKDRSTGQ